MKTKYFLVTVIACFGFLAQSCSDFLSVERYFNDRQSVERVFKSRDYTREWLANAYYYLLNYNLEIGHIRFCGSNFSDDHVYNEGSGGVTYANLRAGNYSPNLFNPSWTQSYRGIRQASILLNNIDINEEMSKEEIDDYKGQAHFLIGYYYWLLLRKYGPVPIVPLEGLDYEDSYEDISLPRSSYDECVEFISERMLDAARLLPDEKRDSRNAARPVSGSALAVRAKAYLYAASPLANGNTDMADFVDHEGRILISQEYDNSKWAKAAAAALDVIKTGQFKLHVSTRRVSGNSAYPKTIEPPYHPVYSNKTWEEGGWADIDPFESYRSMFSGDIYAADNNELIFTRGENQLDPEYGIISLTRHQMPQRLEGYNCHGITAKQVDAYAMADGTPFDYEKRMKELDADPNGKFVTKAELDAGKYPQIQKPEVWKEYVNREPRFYASVAYNGVVFTAASSKEPEFRDQQVFYYRGEQEGRGNHNERWQPTGIGMMKYVNPKDSYRDGSQYQKFDPALRYTDIILAYVEALNEIEGSYSMPSWDGKETYTITRDVAEMKKYFSRVRIRAGIPDIGDVVPGIYERPDDFRTALKRERQVEFLGENQRYYDIRRWKDAPKEEGEPVYGCNTFITKKNAEYFYERVKVPHLQAAFSKKMYFWPVTYDELKRNYRLTQAPGWQSYD